MLQLLPVDGPDGKKSSVQLNIGNLNIEGAETIRAFLIFPMGSYLKLKSNSMEDWGNNFRPINEFLATLNDAEQVVMVKAFATMHGAIRSHVQNGDLADFDMFIKTMGERILGMDLSLNLNQRLREFVETHLPGPNTEHVGKRVQDTDALTFRYDEIRNLQTIALMCKLMSPIYGLIFHLSKVSDLDTGIKEIRCAALLTPWINTHHLLLYLKLGNYESHIIMTGMKDPDTAMFHGVTVHTHTLIICSQLLTRGFVNMNMYDPKSNIVTFIFSATRSHVSAKANDANNMKVMPRQDPTSPSDEHNRAQIEIDGLVSSTTCDTEAIVKSTIPHVVHKYLTMCNISQEDYESAFSWYSTHPIYPSMLNQMLVAKIFGDDLAGARGMFLLYHEDFMKLVTLLQCILMSQGYYVLGHYITANTSARVKTSPTDEDKRLKLNYNSSVMYNNLREKFNYSTLQTTGAKMFDRAMSDLVDDIIGKIHLFNAAPVIWQATKQDIANDVMIDNASNLVREFCEFSNGMAGTLD
jgi:hypothetical protein